MGGISFVEMSVADFDHFLTADRTICWVQCGSHWGYQFVPTFRKRFRFLASGFSEDCHICWCSQVHVLIPKKLQLFPQCFPLLSAGNLRRFTVFMPFGSIFNSVTDTSFSVFSVLGKVERKDSDRQDSSSSAPTLVTEISFWRAFLFRLRVVLGSSTANEPALVGYSVARVEVAVLFFLAPCAVDTKYKLSSEFRKHALRGFLCKATWIWWHLQTSLLVRDFEVEVCDFLPLGVFNCSMLFLRRGALTRGWGVQWKFYQESLIISLKTLYLFTTFLFI